MVGENECPNCGYKLKKETNVSTFDSEAKDHRHIHIPEKIKTPKIDKSSGILVVLLTIIFSGLFLVTVLGVIGWNDSYSDLNFETVIEDELDDEYQTVKKALDYRDKVISYMEDKGLHDVSTMEEVADFDNGTEARCDISGYDEENIRYRVYYIIQLGEKEEFYLNIIANFDNSEMPDSQFPFERVDMFNELMGYNSIKEKFKEKRNELMGDDIDYGDNELYLYEENDNGYVTSADYMIAGYGYEI